MSGSSRNGPDAKGPVNNVPSVLKILNSRLGAEGNLNDSKDAAYFNILMAEAVKLVDRCMFLYVLQATKSQTILSSLLGAGGWATLHSWLQESRSEDAGPFLVELLKLYRRLPITVELLKQNSCAKDIKQLIKSSDHEVASLAKKIVSTWMEAVKEKSSTDGSTKTSSSSIRHDHTSSGKTSSSDRSSKHSSSSDKHTSTSKHSNSKSMPKDSLKDDLDPSRVKTLQDEPDYISAKFNSHSLSADRFYSSNTAPVNDDSNSNNSTSVDVDSSVSQKSSHSSTTVHRPKTVKMIGNKMRSTGLELDTPLPPEKKKPSSPNDKVSQQSIKSQSSSSSSSSSSKKPSHDKKSSHSGSVSSSHGSSAASSSVTDAKSKIKLIPAPKRPPEIFESSGFMDALNSTDTGIGRRKRKLSTAQVSSKHQGSASGAVPVSPDDKKNTPPSFNRDAMETDEVKKSENIKLDSEAASTSEMIESVKTEQSSSNNSASERAAVPEVQSNDDGCSKDSGLSEPSIKKKKVKAVTWVDDSKLCSFFYFQLDETERVNVNKVKDFAEIRKHEQEMERHMMQNVRRMAHDVMCEKQQWRKPFTISLPAPVVVPGSNSKERDIQRERELGVLQVLYFSKKSIPESAAEPEPEYFELIEPKIIPLSDETGSGSEVSYESYQLSNPADQQQPAVSLPPAIANLFNSAPGPMQSSPNNSGTSAPAGNGLLMYPGAANESSSQQGPAGVISLPPLPVFLNMPLQTQQHIFCAMPTHVKQQMLGSLPPPLQQQLGPLISAPPTTNGGPGIPVGRGAASAMDCRPSGPASIPGQPFPLMGPMSRMPQGGPGVPPGGPGMGPGMAGGPGMMMHPPFMGPGSDGPMFPPQRQPTRLPRGPIPQYQTSRVCTHFMSGSCRYGNSCRNLHPPRDRPVGSDMSPGQDSPH